MASVKVAVRVRPFNRRESDLGSRLIVGVDGNQISLDPAPPSAAATPSSRGGGAKGKGGPGGPGATSTPVGASGRPHKFTFDYSYWSHAPGDRHFAGQERVYGDLGTDVVDNAFAGYNACVFAYGQTGSGKTYTMMGSEEGDGRGLIPRICENMFIKMKSGKQEGTTYRTEVSYLEIYNENVKDLLNKSSEHKLRVREHPTTGPYVEDLSKHLVVDYEEIKAIMDEGNKIRTTASTNMNDTSSRSHAIFTITFVNAYFSQGVPHETVSKIHLVDLAGSERADATGATGQRLKEGAHINKSLVTLGSVISALSEASGGKDGAGSKKKVFIPYRDSVLTWLLKDSLGGNSKTIMIATISPAEVNHGETLSTLRYANRAKNIINKPTVNEDENVRLIRELRDEIEHLRSMMSLDPVTLSNVQKKLAVKEAQERHLTEEWTEKWREAANILKEQEALALKRTGLGVILDSDKPHLVGIDEDVMATGITLYHLKDGDTLIGAEESSPDIVLKGPSVEKLHCRIHLDENGNATLVPEEGALCMVNASLVDEPTRLSQGCVVVLGKTNMFRYNDPKEAESMRIMHQSIISQQGEQGGEESGGACTPVNRSLLSQSLSDLRNTPVRSASVGREMMGAASAGRMHASDGDIKGRKKVSLPSSALSPSESLAEEVSEKTAVGEVLRDGVRVRESSEEEEDVDVNMLSSTTTSEPESSCCGGDNNNGGEPLPSASTSKKMKDLYKSICDQKNVIMTCLESDQCDIETLNKQISVLQGMQDRYSKLEYEFTRNMWISSRAAAATPQLEGAAGEDPEASLRSFEEQFDVLVDQEVERRLFQEKVLKQDSDFHEKELQKIQHDREVDEIRRQHEKEIYMLKRRLHEANNAASRLSQQQRRQSGASGGVEQPPVVISIPSFNRSGMGGFVQYEVRVTLPDAAGTTWTVQRRFRRFRDLHMMMCQTYGPAVQALNFPSRRLFGSSSDGVSLERQRVLQVYLNDLIRVCSDIVSCPLHAGPTREAVINFSYFFEPSNESSP